jgi:hypothetical protein
MDDRTYSVPVDAKVKVNDDGEVHVEIYLGYLALGVEEDAAITMAYPPEIVQDDRERIQRVLLASPFNHYINTTLTEE